MAAAAAGTNICFKRDNWENPGEIPRGLRFCVVGDVDVARRKSDEAPVRNFVPQRLDL
jgi:hypothetical protein